MGKDECWLLGAHGTREHVKTLRSVTFANLLAHLYPLALYLRKALTRPNREGTKFCRRQTIAIAMADGYWPVQNVFNNSLCAQQASKLLYLSPGSTPHRQQLRPKIGLCVVGMGGKPLAYLLLIPLPELPLILCRRGRQGEPTAWKGTDRRPRRTGLGKTEAHQLLEQFQCRRYAIPLENLLHRLFQHGTCDDFSGSDNVPSAASFG